MDLSFDHPQLLHLLWLLPVLGALYVWGFTKKRQALERFASVNLLNVLIPAVSVGRQKFKSVLVLAALAMVVLALTGPRWGTHWEEVQRKGVDLMFVLDVSNSMLAEDTPPSRLERAKLDIKDLLEILPGDRVGLVTFSGKAVLTCPMTINYGAFRLALDEVDTRSSPVGGTNIGDALRYAADAFSDKIKEHKAIIVLSDGGETDESYAAEAARKAFDEKGVRVFTVGYGDTVQGGRIPIGTGGQRTYLKDPSNGQEKWTKLEPATLQSLAAVADGGYFTNTDMTQVYERIRGKVEEQTFETTRKQMRYPRYHWFAAVALLLLTMETLMTDRKVTTS